MPNQIDSNQSLVENFKAFLSSKKEYPAGSLRANFQVSAERPTKADIAILNLETSEVAGVLEFKLDLDSFKSEQTRAALLQLTRIVGTGCRAAYLIGPGDLVAQQFTILQVFNDREFEPILEQNFPRYQELLDMPFRKWPQGSKPTKTKSKARVESITQASVSDQPTTRDSLGFEPYVEALARFLLNKDTRPPLTVSVEGEWGSGKSSFMKQLVKRLESSSSTKVQKTFKRAKVRTVWFNAWRHDKSDALWAAFALEFVEQISKKMRFWERWYAGWRLMKQRFNWRSGWIDVVAFMAVLFAWITLAFSATYLWVLSGFSIKGLITGKAVLAWKGELLDSALRSGGITSLIIAVILIARKSTSILGNPLKNNLRRHLKCLDYVDRVAFIEKFHADFSKIVRAYVGNEKVFVFIDDLDRCEIPTASELMQTLNLMIAEENPIIFIIGMDREKVAAGIAAKQEKILPYLLRRENNSATYRENADAIEYGLSFIEKFIQLPIRVPVPSPDNLEPFLADLRGAGDGALSFEMATEQTNNATEIELSETGREKPLSGKSGENKEPERDWDKFALRVAQDSMIIQEMVTMVAPALDYNPRKLKQFINVFRLEAYICFDTGLFNPPLDNEHGVPLTFERLAKFVAISLRWPTFISDWEADPELLVEFGQEPVDSTPAGNYWKDRKQLIALISYKPRPRHPVFSDKKNDDFSLTNFDISQLLRVWPSVQRESHSEKSSDAEIGNKKPIGPGEQLTSFEAQEKARDILQASVTIMKSASNLKAGLLKLSQLQRNWNTERQQVSVVSGGKLVLHARPELVGRPMARQLFVDGPTNKWLYPKMRMLKSGTETARIPTFGDRITAIAFQSIDQFDCMIITEVHYFERRLPVP